MLAASLDGFILVVFCEFLSHKHSRGFTVSSFIMFQAQYSDSIVQLNVHFFAITAAYVLKLQLLPMQMLLFSGHFLPAFSSVGCRISVN